MQLKGSCHCGAIHFEVEAPHPYPYNLCYCSICRKTAGGGGFAINLGADRASLKIEGEQNTAVYHAKIGGQASPAERHFCPICASALWVYDPRWPELLHPFASAIDTELPLPPGAHPPDAGEQGELGSTRDRTARQMFRRVPRRKHRPMAPALEPG